MTIHTTGNAQIRHAQTGTVYTIPAQDLDWYEVDSDEREMGPEITHEAEIDHPDLGQLVWRVWEYPLGVENDREIDIGAHELVQNFNISLNPDVDPEEQAAQVEALVDWFHKNYEDPAERTPYESAEGGYIWIWGGPYDAREVLQDEFEDVPDAILEAAVREIESDGLVEWAPKERPGDYDPPDPEDVEESFNPADETAARLGELAEDEDASTELGPGPVFGLDETGRIGLLRWTPSSDLPGTALLEALREAADTLVERLRGTNAHQDLFASAQRYSAAVAESALSISQLFAEGVFLENAVARLDREVAAGELPALAGGAREALDSVTDLHGACIMATDEGRRLVEGAARYKRTAEAQAALDRSAERIATLVEQAEDIFSPEVRAYVSDAARQAGKGPHPTRSNQLVTMVLGGAIFALTSVAATIIGNGVAAAPAGAAMTESVTVLTTTVGNFLIAHITELQIFANLVAHEWGALAPALSRLLPGRAAA